MAKYISCGKINNYYKYIILTVIFSFISTSLFGYGYCNYAKEIYFGQVYPNEIQDVQVTLSHHIIIHNFYRNIFIYIISMILVKYEQKNFSDNDKNIENAKRIITKEVKLIYEESQQYIKRESDFNIYLVILIFVIQDILTNLYFHFDLSEFNLWVFELPLLSYFNNKLLNTKIYGHHKFGIYLSIILPLIINLVIKSIHVFAAKFNYFIYNKYKSLTFIGIFSFLIIIIIRSYALTKIKIFMDFYYISPAKILTKIGLVGIIVNFIIMIIFTFIKCGTIYDIDIHLCSVDENNNRNETYLENFIIYFRTLNNAKYYDILISVFTILIGIMAYFCYIYFYILIIRYLSSVHIIIYALLNSFIIRILAIIIISFNNSLFEEHSTPLIFSISAVSDFFSGAGLLIYCEIIELNFCNFNYFLRRNIIARSSSELKINSSYGNIENLLEEDKDFESEDSNGKMVNLNQVSEG